MSNTENNSHIDAIERKEEVPLLSLNTATKQTEVSRMTADSFTLSADRAKSGETAVNVHEPEDAKHHIFTCMKLSGFDKVCAIFAELIGVFLLVFIGCMSCVDKFGMSPLHLQIALAFGLAIMVGAQSVGHISGGHFNPAVTVAAMIHRGIDVPMGLAYIAAQLVGSVLGYGLLKVISTHEAMFPAGEEATGLCVTMPAAGLGVTQAFFVEFICTGILVLVVCGIWDPRNKKHTDSTPLRVGLTVAVLVLVAGPYTGGSLNPARSFGPAVWSGDWANNWLYWIAPTLGGAVVSLIYKTTFWRESNDD
ncbi:aquaporin-like isoform X2 [Culicoides brevitarsis]|uniref:aquaporin-like isoform X2 n=1 Tax=Culicoides brevitarsis TaxID=469753 RepID=UPI00307CA495